MEVHQVQCGGCFDGFSSLCASSKMADTETKKTPDCLTGTMVASYTSMYVGLDLSLCSNPLTVTFLQQQISWERAEHVADQTLTGLCVYCTVS